jgi:hypothetical protein
MRACWRDAAVNSVGVFDDRRSVLKDWTNRMFNVTWRARHFFRPSTIAGEGRGDGAHQLGQWVLAGTHIARTKSQKPR